MGENLSFLITMSDGNQLTRVAIVVRQSMLSGDALEYRLEPENKKQWFNLLPQHCRDLGSIVQIEEIFEVVTF